VIAFTLYRASPSEALASLGEASNPAHGREDALSGAP